MRDWMIDCPDYRRATNRAYTVLNDLHISKYPIEIYHIIDCYMNIRVIPYSLLCIRRGITWNALMNLNVSEKGFIVKRGELFLMFYNDTLDDEIIRFTLAHELGHYSLDHQEDNEATDKEANCFARNILSPVPIRDYLSISEVSECCDAFNISPPAAEVVLDKCNLDRINTDFDVYQEVVKLFALRLFPKKTTFTQATAKSFLPHKVDNPLDWDSVIGY